MIERHFHWKFCAWDGELDPITRTTEFGKFSVLVEVIGYETEGDALIAAQAILAREHFILQSVWECSACGYQNRAANAMDALVKVAS